MWDENEKENINLNISKENLKSRWFCITVFKIYIRMVIENRLLTSEERKSIITEHAFILASVSNYFSPNDTTKINLSEYF